MSESARVGQSTPLEPGGPVQQTAPVAQGVHPGGEHERLLELSRRLQAVVQELREYAPEKESRAGSRSSRILVNASFRAIADIGSKVATAALYIFVARKLGPSQFGIFAFALSFVGLVTQLGFFGQDIVLAREVSRDRSRLEQYYSDAMLSRLMFSIPPLLLALTIAWLAGMSHYTVFVLLLLGIGFAGDYMVQVPFAVFQAYERIEFVAIVLIAQRWLTTGIAIVALYMGLGLVEVVAIYCAGSLSAAALGTAMMYRHIARPRLHINFRGAMQVTREAFPIGIALLALGVLFRVDMSMLAMFRPAREVGQYGAAYKLLETTAFFSWAVNVAVLPSLARLTPTSDPPVGFVYQRGLKLLWAITVPVAVGAIVLAGPIISLVYGPGYQRAATALVLLAPTIVLFPISSISSQLFYTQQRRPMVAFVYAAVGLENVLLNLILIPKFGLVAAAAGTSFSELLVSMTLLMLLGELHGRLQLRRMLGGPLLGGAVAALVFVGLHDHLLLAAPLGILAYLAVLLGYERVAFPDDFSVIRVFVAQLRSRFAGTPAPGGAS